MRKLVFTAMTLAMGVSSQAFSADMVYEPAPVAPPPVETKEWTFTVAPYIWGAGLTGDVGVFGLDPTEVDMTFGDVLENLDVTGMIVGELHNGQWGVLADLIYVQLSTTERVFGQVQNTPAELRVGLEATTFTATLMGEYRLVSQPNYIVDLMAGARVWSVNNDISATLSAGGAPVAGLSGSDGATWVDPMIGVKGRVDLTPKWNLSGWGMIGGFGAGSEITWDLLGAVGYKWTDKFSTRVGYRALGVDYSDDGFVYDTIQHGPVIGFLFSF